MALEKADLVNIQIFMERATCQGKEALAWSQTYEAVQKEIAAQEPDKQHIRGEQ